MSEKIGQFSSDKMKLAERLFKKAGIKTSFVDKRLLIFPPDNLSSDETKQRAIGILDRLKESDKIKVLFT